MEKKYVFDVAYTSLLDRAIDTLEIIQSEIKQPDLTVIKTWILNERHYGALTGLDKSNNEYSKEQVITLDTNYNI